MIRQDLAGWMSNVDIAELHKRVLGRSIFIWGAFTQGKYIYDFLVENQIVVTGYCDSYNSGIYAGKEVYRFEDICNNDKIYIFIAVNEIREEIMNQLNNSGLKPEIDYCYIFHKYIVTPFSNYRDLYNNEIIFQSYIPDLSIEVIGYGSKIYIGKNVVVSDGKATIQLGSNSTIYIDDGVSLRGNTNIAVINNSSIRVGKKCTMYNGKMLAYDSITIGNKVNLGENIRIISNIDAPITIGNDCLFSHDVQIRSGDGHSIFDLDKEESLMEEKKRYVIIGDHVWSGSCVTIMHNADIGKGCVIGTGSLINKKTENNVLVAGNTAKVIRNKIVWEEEDGLVWEDFVNRNLMNNYFI